MTKVRLNPLIAGIHGTMYDVVFKKSRKAKMIVAKRPDMSNVESSEAQQAQRQRFNRQPNTPRRRWQNRRCVQV
jgi:hypothetical protein